MINIRRIRIHRPRVRELASKCAIPFVHVEAATMRFVVREVLAAKSVDAKLVNLTTPKDNEAYEADARVIIIPHHRYMNG